MKEAIGNIFSKWEIPMLINVDQNLKLILFLILLGSIYMITAENILLSCFSLIFIFICGMFVNLCLNLWFIGLLILIIYIGAIATLFLFIILMIDLYIKVERENNFERTVAIFLIFIVLVIISSFDFDYLILNEKISTSRTYIDFFQLNENTHTNIQIAKVFFTTDMDPSDFKNDFSLDGNDIIVLGKLLYTHFSIILIFAASSLLIAIAGVLITSEGLAKREYIKEKTGNIIKQQMIERKQESFHQVLKLYRINK